MDIRKINDAISVSPQIAPEDIAVLAALGFKTLMANRPDGEDPGQPDFAELAALATRHGMAVVHAPIVSGAPDPQAVALFAQALDEATGPVFAYCRSGTRSAMLYALARLEKGDAPAAIFPDVRQAGYAFPGLEMMHGYRPQ